ncbi:MAG: fimbrillin family protein [Clostridia bacterium]|nr:fimbrillin family protein [Clostridia bacterium]
MKKLTLILLSVLMIVTLAACGSKKCEQHVYDDCADIECNECGEKRDSMHSWKEADCITAKTCSVCGKTEGESLGHEWTTPDVDLCEVQSTCSRCGATDGENKEHTPENDDNDCSTALNCGVCGKEILAAGEHSPEKDDGNCTTAITCSLCGTITTPAKDSHTGGTATCTEKAVCAVCSTAYGTVDANNHIDENIDHICDRECGKTDIGTHADSAEDNDHVCDYGCGVTLEEHKGGTATCAAQKVCTICGNGYGNLAPENHDFGSGNTCICGSKIEFTGFIYISDEIYTYDESANTYTVIIPPNYYGADAKFHITGKNLEYLESDNALLKVKENHSLVGEYDFSLEDFLSAGFEVGWGSMQDGSWLEYQYSNDGGITWSKAVRAEVKQSYYVTVNASENGSVTAKEYAVAGETVTLNVSADKGYMLDTLSVTDASGNTIVVENNQFTMPASAVTVNATFAVCDHKDSRHETATDNDDGTHSFTCTVCGVTGTENHTIENHLCTACGAMEIIVSFDAGDFEWKTGDTLYFCRVSRDNQWEEYCFIATVAEDGTVTWTPDKPLYWDGTGEHRLFVSYPCTAVGWDDFMIPTDQSDVDKLKEADCINARWVGTPTTNVIEFELKHRMAKITVNYSIASQFDSDAPVIAEIYSNAKYCTFSDADGLPIITSVGQYDAWIIPYHNDNQFTAYVAPGEYNTDGMFKFYIGDSEVQIEINNPGAVTLEEGGEYTFDVKVGQDVITIAEVSMGDIDSPFGDGWNSETDLKAIGTQAEGKTYWEDGDQIIVTFTSPWFGTQYGTLTYDGNVGSWSTDVLFSYLEGEIPTVSAIYAPCYEVVDGNMQLKDGMQLGMTEYISAACSITDGTLNISFKGATRNYSRLRIVGLANQTLTVITTGFTPAGATEEATKSYTLTTDGDGNADLYGMFAEGATILVQLDETELAQYSFYESTANGMSYALDALDAQL